MGEKSIVDIDLDTLIRNRSFHPSPEKWSDQALYFLLIDRFSDGKETNYKDSDGRPVKREGRPRFRRTIDTNNAVKTPAEARKWREAGNAFAGGNIRGLTEKLGYLKRLGVTTLWVSPVFKQRKTDTYSYHGYAIQNFLEIDPRFGTREDLRNLVSHAHALGIYVILDIIVNHCADVFAYGESEGNEFAPTYTGDTFPVKGFRDKDGKPTLPFGTLDLQKYPDAWPSGAVWPTELQTPEAFSRKGSIQHWDKFPEFEEGDFFSFKDLYLGKHDENGVFQPSPALEALVKAYQFWIVWADIDGYRLDTVKHMGQGATNYFTSQIREFAASLGKKNFFLIGEIAGGRANAFTTMQTTGLDAALGIDEIPTLLRDVVMGRGNPADYFRLFRNGSGDSDGPEDDLTWWCGKVVTFFDDHDQVGRPVKARFASEFGSDTRRAERAILAALGMNLMTIGVPCLYYGTEQGFNGHALGEDGGDRYVREALFGGAFGSFGSRDRHFFNETNSLYKEIAKLLALRNKHPTLRHGSQYLREVSENGTDFALPQAGQTGEWRGLVAWSRLHEGDEIVVVLNTDPKHEHSAWVTVDPNCHVPNSCPLKCLYSTDPTQVGTETSGPPERTNGSAICITVPPGGFVVYA